MDYKAILADIVVLAKQVGSFQRENLRKTDLVIDTKSTVIDLVTEVDKQSDALISSYLRAHFPDHGLLTEESGVSGPESDWLWVVDPLDGTTNFAQGLPIFCVSIALQHRGETMLGVVYAPVMDELFTAIRGQGAWCNGKKMRLSGKTDLRASVLVTGFPYDLAENPVNNLDYFCAMSAKTRAVRRFGSAAYDLALVADGRFDGQWEMALNLWDIAAAALMVEEAGGRVISFREDRKKSIVAANPILCDAILAQLRMVDGM